jgi:DNA-binding NtrC family response regulator
MSGQKVATLPERETIIAKSGIMREIMEGIEQIAQSDANVLLTGENGTGKTEMAALLHRKSHRAAKRFVAVNMGAIPEAVFESEFFGHVRGAFTDAKGDRVGRVELAHEGTLFMDEISNTPLVQQAKLLRLLDQKEFERIGSSQTEVADLRFIGATNADLAALVRDNRFRLDLLFRINTIEIKLPPLKERNEDLPLLAEHFLRKFAIKHRKPGLELHRSAIEAILAHSWPGNIRELSNVMERSVVLCQNHSIRAQDLSLRALGQSPRSENLPSPPEEDLGRDTRHATLDEIEDVIVRRRLADFDNDVIKTAISLGISRSALYRRLQKSRDKHPVGNHALLFTA